METQIIGAMDRRHASNQAEIRPSPTPPNHFKGGLTTDNASIPHAVNGGEGGLEVHRSISSNRSLFFDPGLQTNKKKDQKKSQERNEQRKKKTKKRLPHITDQHTYVPLTIKIAASCFFPLFLPPPTPPLISWTPMRNEGGATRDLA